MYYSMPNPDGQIQFEDLAIFSMGYGKSATHQLSKAQTANVNLSVQTPVMQDEGAIVVPLMLDGDVERLHALSVSVRYSASLWEYTGYEKCGELNHDIVLWQQIKQVIKLSWMLLLSALVYGISSSGVIANLFFKNRSQWNNGTVAIQSVTARDKENANISVTIGQSEPSALHQPTAYALSQNFPNPFNPSTVISYQLPVSCFVNLYVYDLLGRDVASLEHGLQEAGIHQVSFYALHLLLVVFIFTH